MVFLDMIEVIPSINSPTFEEVREKIKLIEPHVQWCHLDVTDGVFSNHLTWHNPADLPLLDTKLKAEVHLMVENPEKYIGQWLISPIKRIIVHLEAVKDLDFIIQKCREADVEIGLSIKPDTSWEKIKPWFGRVDLIHVLAVNPGPSGQKMAEETLDKVQHLRANCPDCQIEIDGGVNLENLDRLERAGANMLVVGGAIFNSPNPIEELTKFIPTPS